MKKNFRGENFKISHGYLPILAANHLEKSVPASLTESATDSTPSPIHSSVTIRLSSFNDPTVVTITGCPMSRLWDMGFRPTPNLRVPHPSRLLRWVGSKPLRAPTTFPLSLPLPCCSLAVAARYSEASASRLNSPPRSGLRSAEGQSAAQRAKQRIYCRCFCLFSLQTLKNPSKNICQAPNPSNPNKTKPI